MNKDGGLSVFDVKSNTTKEILDNTTFVSIHMYLPIWTTPGWYYVSVGWKQNLESKSVKSYFLEILGGLKDHILCYKHYKYSGCLHTKKKANRSIVRATQYTEYKPHLKMSNWSQLKHLLTRCEHNILLLPSHLKI